ncbi:MAG TPA: type IV pilus biogenesis protein EbsA [Candidatus Obscuribacterales bacterium]
MSIDQLQPAEKGAVGIYMPYYQGAKRNMLPLAISLYQQGSLEGNRKVEGGESIPFVATWYVSQLPSELTRCRLQFDGNAELSYEVMMANSEFINYLIEVIINFKSNKNVDFSQPFYRRLLRLEE